MASDQMMSQMSRDVTKIHITAQLPLSCVHLRDPCNCCCRNPKICVRGCSTFKCFIFKLSITAETERQRGWDKILSFAAKVTLTGPGGVTVARGGAGVKGVHFSGHTGGS